MRSAFERYRALRAAIGVGLILSVSTTPAFGWGAKGHTMAGRVAVRNLPPDAPLFLRAAVDRLGYQIPEPDRWRGQSWGGHGGPRVELTNLTAGNHNIRMELLEGIQFPITRNEYIVLMVEKGIVPRDEVNMHKVGMLFYAIIEEMQRLTVEFRLWREAQEARVPDPSALQQIQENALYSAGVLGHWITDASQPLHTTVHSDDWDTRFPNPKNYVTKGIHGRFEGQYVDRTISEADIQLHMTEVRVLADWRSEAEAHIRRSFSHFEEVYALDRRGAFASGQEPEEAHAFTATRLAEGAAMLRDAWYSTWKASERELWDMPVRTTGRNGRSALDLLRDAKLVESRGTGSGLIVTAIGNRINGADGRQWKLYSGDKPVAQSPAQYIPADGQQLEWRFSR